MNAAAELSIFAGVMVLGQFSPGPDMILLTRTALAEGARAGMLVGLGIATGIALHTTVALAGLALALERMPVLRKAVAYFSAAYLLWLAYGIAREHFIARYSGGKRDEPEIKRGSPYVRGFVCNLLNPKAVIFLAAVCAPFLHGAHPVWWPFALWTIVVLQCCVLWALWARLLQWRPLRSRYERCSKWIDLAFALALTALAVRLLFTR